MQKITKAFFIILVSVWSILIPFYLEAKNIVKKPLKILHLTFHEGCAKDFEAICDHFGFDLETWFIPSLPSKSFDGITSGCALYNIGHERALNIWNLHKDTFQQFDAIITSDTAPLARIFLQNGFTKPLIIWICNRFDYYDQTTLDCDFPDPEFYRLFKEARQKENVTIISYTEFEQIYALQKGVDLGDLIITPCTLKTPSAPKSSFIPSYLVKEELFFLPAYHNETIFFNFADFCKTLGIPTYCGRYNGPLDLKDFKGIIHLPYAWSNLALFENLALGIPYFIPSPKFLLKLLKKNNYWHQDSLLLNEQTISVSEWYNPERREIFTYFNSWKDLKMKIKHSDYKSLREKTKEYSKNYKANMLYRWDQVFGKILSNTEFSNSN